MSVIQLKKCTLPETNIKHYLTAITALNIYSEDGTGDWYFSENYVSSMRQDLFVFRFWEWAFAAMAGA
jgi:hypothetical protein